jgi:hypothetical protein
VGTAIGAVVGAGLGLAIGGAVEYWSQEVRIDEMEKDVRKMYNKGKSKDEIYKALKKKHGASFKEEDL